MAQHSATRAQVAFALPVGSPSSNPEPVDLEIYRTDDGYIVAQNRTIVFYVRKPSTNAGFLRKYPVAFLLTDYDKNTIFTLCRKNVTAHHRWKVFRGDSSDPKHLLFRSAKTAVVQQVTEFAISFENKEAEVDSLNPKKEKKKANVVYDFKLKKTSSHSSFAIYSGDSSTKVAEGEKPKSGGNLKVTIYPNMDRAVVTAIIVILDQTKGIPFKLPLCSVIATGNIIDGLFEES